MGMSGGGGKGPGWEGSPHQLPAARKSPNEHTKKRLGVHLPSTRTVQPTSVGTASVVRRGPTDIDRGPASAGGVQLTSVGVQLTAVGVRQTLAGARRHPPTSFAGWSRRSPTEATTPVDTRRDPSSGAGTWSWCCSCRIWTSLAAACVSSCRRTSSFCSSFSRRFWSSNYGGGRGRGQSGHPYGGGADGPWGHRRPAGVCRACVGRADGGGGCWRWAQSPEKRGGARGTGGGRVFVGGRSAGCALWVCGAALSRFGSLDPSVAQTPPCNPPPAAHVHRDAL